VSVERTKVEQVIENKMQICKIIYCLTNETIE
jgi:hypothetical protein